MIIGVALIALSIYLCDRAEGIARVLGQTGSPHPSKYRPSEPPSGSVVRG
jgi:hypothetical protein